MFHYQTLKITQGRVNYEEGDASYEAVLSMVVTHSGFLETERCRGNGRNA